MYLYKCDVQCKDIDILYPPRKITISQMTFEIFPLNKSRREMTSDVLFGWPQRGRTQITLADFWRFLTPPPPPLLASLLHKLM